MRAVLVRIGVARGPPSTSFSIRSFFPMEARAKFCSSAGNSLH